MSDDLQEISREHKALSRFVVYILITVAVYNLAVEVMIRLRHLHKIPASAVTAGTVLIVSLVLLRMIRGMGYPLREFGLNLNNLKRNVRESLVWTLGFCLFLLVVKWLLITQVELFASWTLFYHPRTHDFQFEIVAALIYAVFAFFQCFIVHGAFQSSLIKLLAQPRAVLLSVITTTLMFASLHIDMHFTFALATLPPGLMWSIMYAKQRSLVGVTISHGLVGLWAFWGLDFYRVLNLILASLGPDVGGF